MQVSNSCRCDGTADVHDSKSCGKPCGFKSHHRYQGYQVGTDAELYLFQPDFLYYTLDDIGRKIDLISNYLYNT